jgi:hypothetical protein
MDQTEVNLWVAVIAASAALLGGLVTAAGQAFVERGRRAQAKADARRAERREAYVALALAIEEARDSLNVTFGRNLDGELPGLNAEHLRRALIETLGSVNRARAVVRMVGSERVNRLANATYGWLRGQFEVAHMVPFNTDAAGRLSPNPTEALYAAMAEDVA